MEEPILGSIKRSQPESDTDTTQINSSKTDDNEKPSFDDDTHNSPLDSNDDSSDSEEKEDLEIVDRYFPWPVETKLEFAGSAYSKSVQALTINNAGTRFASGGNDQEISIWDFSICNRTKPSPVIKCRPCGTSIINNLYFSNEDDLILVIPATCQARILKKDCSSDDKLECPKGDQYLTDMAKTKGHVQMLNDGGWNPKDNHTFLTCSNDGTIRIWDINNLKEQKTVIKTRASNGLKTIANSCQWTKDLIIAGCNDGSVLMWDTRRKFLLPSSTIKSAHCKGNEITGLHLSYSGTRLCTRSDDNSLKIWDLRQIKSPLASNMDLTNSYTSTSCCFSPDDNYVITGTSSVEESKPGKLVCLKVETCEILDTIELPKISVIRCSWHPKINHIIYTCSNGAIYVCYDTNRSLDGMKLAGTLNNNNNNKRRKYKR